MPQTMLAVSLRVTVTLTALNSVGCIKVEMKISGMPAGAHRCRNWDPRTLGPAVCSYFGLNNKNMRVCSYFDCVLLYGVGA